MSTSQQQTISEQNKALLHRWFEELWNQGRLETIKELFAKDGVLHDGADTYRGPEEFMRFYNALRLEFSNVRILPIVSLSENDLACVHWSADGKHTATGKPVHITGMSIVRIKNGQFVEAWQNWDAAGAAKQVS